MEILIWIITAVCSYLIAGINPAIIMSNLIYKQDIRELGSGNPGFTNFKRSFGSRYAWFVFALDLLKAALPELIAGFAFSSMFGNWQTGVAYAGIFAVLGHAFPPFYHFKGGKGVSVSIATIFLIDWRAGLIAAAVLALLLLTARYMSLSTMCALVCGCISLIFFGADTAAVILYAICVIIVIIRHKDNILRLIHGEEKRFNLFKSKS